MRRTLLLAFALLAPLTFSACDSGGDETPPPVVGPSAPTFSIASRPATFDDGRAGLEFFATPSASVTLTEVVITNPVGQSERFNANNNAVLSGAATPLQVDGFAYFRVSGNWTFRFVGARSPAVTDGAFDVTQTLAVGAFAPEGTPSN